MKMTTVAIALVLALGLTATNSKAESFDLSSLRYIGNINDGIPSSEAKEVTYINNLINSTLMPLNSGPTVIGTETYTRSNNSFGSLPVAAVTDSIKVNFDDPDFYTGTSINVTGFTYILGKYDAEKAGSYVWNVSGLTTVDIPTTLPFTNKYNLSHYSLYKYNPTSVPDGGITLMLLGGALVGLETLRRKLRA